MSETMLSPRRRRLRLTATLLAIVGVIGGISGIALHLRMRPTEYRPDERPEDITSMLAASLPTNAPSPRLAEVSGEAGLDGFRNFAGKRTSQLPEDMGPGLAWGDFDNDGDDDLFLVSAGGSLDVADNDLFPSQLFANLGNGSFRLCTGFPELRIRGMGAAWGDFDGDGFLDLAVSGYNALRLFRNDRAPGGSCRMTGFQIFLGSGLGSPGVTSTTTVAWISTSATTLNTPRMPRFATWLPSSWARQFRTP
jgi:hypothetical protein